MIQRKIVSLSLLIIGIMTFWPTNPSVMASAPPVGGLWATYLKRFTCHIPAAPTQMCDNARTVAIENINYGIGQFNDELLDRTGVLKNAQVVWKGSILADVEGDYKFRINMNGDTLGQFEIDNVSLASWTTLDKSFTTHLTAGWHSIRILYRTKATATNPQMQMYWTPPAQTEEIVPADHLGYHFWSDYTLTIPSQGEPKAKVDYVASGVGTEGSSNVVIEIDSPTANFDDVWKNEVLVFWNERSYSIDSLFITNENTGNSSTQTLTGIKDPYGLEEEFGLQYAKIPANLIDDGGSGKLKLSFEKSNGSVFDIGGIGIIVPFDNNDPSAKEGRILLRLSGASTYQSIGPTMVFPVNEDNYNDIRPIFFGTDGESKVKYAADGVSYRPNYLMMLSGSGSSPQSSDVLRLMGGQLYLPKIVSTVFSDHDALPPLFGRERGQLDVLSPNYVSNQWPTVSSQYHFPGVEGFSDVINVPSDHTWIAFQMVGSSYNEDPNCTGGGESGAIMGGGLFSTLNLDEVEYNLSVNVVGNGKVTSSPGTIDCPGV